MTGQPDRRIRGNIMNKVVKVTASGENPPDEIAIRVTDGEVSSKWLTFTKTGWVGFELDEPIAVKRYAISSANDYSERDPSTWAFEGSQDGQSWTALDQQSNQSFAERFETRTYEFTNTTAYRHYRLNVTAVRGASSNILQLSEVQLSTGDDAPPAVTDVMKSEIGGGPVASWNARPGAGFTGTRALRFAGAVTANGRGYSYNKLFDVNIKVTPTTELSYLIFIDGVTTGDTRFPSTYAALDLAFDDGTYLSDLNAVDQHHAVLSPAGQGASRTLYSSEWNRKVSRIGDVAAGKTIKRILIGYDQPTGPVPAFGGWIDDVRITAHPVHVKPARLSDYASTLRGTNSSGSYSRGNN
ncbi:MAG: discoidin domain-containing protein, partial [Cystobacter sp.]